MRVKGEGPQCDEKYEADINGGRRREYDSVSWQGFRRAAEEPEVSGVLRSIGNECDTIGVVVYLILSRVKSNPKPSSSCPPVQSWLFLLLS